MQYIVVCPVQKYVGWQLLVQRNCNGQEMTGEGMVGEVVAVGTPHL